MNWLKILYLQLITSKLIFYFPLKIFLTKFSCLNDIFSGFLSTQEWETFSDHFKSHKNSEIIQILSSSAAVSPQTLEAQKLHKTLKMKEKLTMTCNFGKITTCIFENCANPGEFGEKLG